MVEHYENGFCGGRAQTRRQGEVVARQLLQNRPYTIRQLLQHTAGLNTYGGPPYCAAVAAGDPVWPVAELLARVKADRLIFSPGEGWAYSDVGYLFVRQLIEETVARVRCELYQIADCRQR